MGREGGGTRGLHVGETGASLTQVCSVSLGGKTALYAEPEIHHSVQIFVFFDLPYNFRPWSSDCYLKRKNKLVANG